MSLTPITKMTDDEQIRELIARLEHVERAVIKLGQAGLMVARNLDMSADWMMSLSERVERLEGGKSKLS